MNKYVNKIICFQIKLDFDRVFPDKGLDIKSTFTAKYTEAILKYCRNDFPDTLNH